jgi:predicted nucleotidyltransferase
MTGPTLIFETIHGSRAFGLDRAGSDEDRKGVIVGPRAWYLGYRGGPEQLEPSADHVRFELRKFLKLAVANNPTIFEMLFADESDHRALTTAGRRLLDARGLFPSRRVADTFGRYAEGQLRRIRTHRRWLLTPPAEAPTRAAFGLPERTIVPKDQLGAAAALVERDALAMSELSPAFLDLLGREKRYAASSSRRRSR